MPDDHLQKIKISFIGGGNMARALMGGLCTKFGRPNDIHVVDINIACLDQLKSQFGVRTSQQIDASLAESEVILLAVKPQQLHDVVVQLTPYLNQQLVISIAAGIRILDLSRWLQNYPAIVRTMPNMPALINWGITGMYAMPNVSSEQRAMADAILSSVGKTVWLNNEVLLDSVTAVSGSGPGYVFYFIEAMQKAAEELGLTPEQSRELAVATFLGAAQLACQSDESISTLRQQVMSKGGTTYAAIHHMELNSVSDAIVAALKLAAERSCELGNEFGRMH